MAPSTYASVIPVPGSVSLPLAPEQPLATSSSADPNGPLPMMMGTVPIQSTGQQQQAVMVNQVRMDGMDMKPPLGIVTNSPPGMLSHQLGVVTGPGAGPTLTAAALGVHQHQPSGPGGFIAAQATPAMMHSHTATSSDACASIVHCLMCHHTVWILHAAQFPCTFHLNEGSVVCTATYTTVATVQRLGLFPRVFLVFSGSR